MASKLFAPFKKFPQQLPIFKKSSDKLKDVSMSNYNSIYGMLDDVTSQTFDNELHLLALGTKKGEIKIYGSPGIVYTLVNSPLKSINFLKFLEGQGRIISVNNENEMVLWEYKTENTTWEIASSLNLSNYLSNGKVTSLDVSRSFSWKSDSDDLLELLIVGSSTSKIQLILITGSRFHLYEGNDLTIDSVTLLTKFQDFDKDYDFGGVDEINFHPSNNEQFFISFKNGLILIIEIKITKDHIIEITEINDENTEKKKNEENVQTDNVLNENIDKSIEITEEIKSPETVEITNVEKDNVMEQNITEKEDSVAEKSEIEKEKQVEDTQKSEELKQDTKKYKESIQVPYANVQIPIIVNYIIYNKKLRSVCWTDNKIAIVEDNSNLIDFYEINVDNSKLIEPVKTITLPENYQSLISKFSYIDLNGENIGIFITHMNEKQNLLIILKNDQLFAEIETPSQIINYLIVKGRELSSVENIPQIQSYTLLILCESQLIAIDLKCENLTELECPYLVLKNTSQITSLTSITQAPASLFSNAQNINELFKNWPVKSSEIPNEKVDDDTCIDIIGTGHTDGSINVWQILQSGVICLLLKIDSCNIFNQELDQSACIDNLNAFRKRVGYRLNDVDDNLLQITNLQLLLNCPNSFSESLSNELSCIAGNACGTVLVFKYDGTDNIENVIEISSNFDKEGIIWNDSEAPELLDKLEINQKLPKLKYIVRLNPSLPVTSMTFQPSWELLSIGCTYGLVLVDFRQNKCVFSHITLQKSNKSISQPPLSVGQQLKKSIRQSFRKLKKLKPAAKHTYTVNEEKPKDKEEKPEDKDENKDVAKPDEDDTQKENQPINEDIEINEDKLKEDHTEENDNTVITNENIVDTADTEIVTLEISRKDRPLTTVGSLLIVNTSLTSQHKIPCLFAGTNAGAIFAFEILFDDSSDNNLTIKLSKELHLQHKAPILLISIINSNHIPLLGPIDQIGSFQRKVKNVDELKYEDEKLDSETNVETKKSEVEIGPSGDDNNNEEDAKQKSGTLPSPVVQEEIIEPSEGARRSVDSSKDKIIMTNVNMKKSGTLPASFLQAIGKSQSSSDCHEMLVVSEEQVKLFSLPSLKAKYKYKVVDTGHHFSHSKSIAAQEIEKNEVNVDAQNENLISKPIIRRISSVGLCKTQGLKSTGNKWSVVIALTNGEIVGLQISNLKKYLLNVFNYSINPIVAGISNGELNLIVSYAHKFNLQITDFSQSNIHRYEPYVTISIPKSARPIIEEKVETEIKVNQSKEEKLEAVTTDELVVNGLTNGHDEEEEKDQMGDEAIVQNASATHHGDITMDSIKEYITNVDGNVIIKTFESSKEKLITVDGRQVITTVHEKQIKDGEIIKDDVVKINSDTRSSNELSMQE